MKKTRILSLILALCMVFSLFAVPVSASDSGSDVSIQSSGEDSSDKEKEKKEEEEKKKKEEEERKKKEEEEKKKKEEERKKKEEEEKKKQEEEQKKKEEEERKKKEEEEQKKKEEEERKKKEEEEKKKQEDKSDSSGDKSDKSGDKSDKSDSSGSKSDSSGDKSDKSDSSGSKSDSSGDKSGDKSDKSDSSGSKSDSSGSASSGDGSGSGSASSGDGSGSGSASSGDGSGSGSASSGDGSGSGSASSGDGSGSDSSDGSASQSGAESSQEDLSAQDEEQEQTEEEQKEEEQKEEEKKEEEKKEDEEKDVDKKVHAKLISDESGERTLTAADFSDYDPTDKKADGASVSFDRLITLKVTDLKADDTSEGKKNLSRIESVMTWIKRQHKKNEYKNTMFKVVIPKGTYYINGENGNTNRCIHLYDHTWLSMNDVTLIKSDTRNRAIIRSGAASDSVSGYGGESNIILEGGVIDGNTRIHKSKTQHFSGVRFGHNRDILIANVHFKGNVCGHHLELCGVKDISVVGCTFTDYKDSGYTKGINRNEAIQIDVTNSATLTPTYARYDDTVTGNVVIYNSKFEDLSRGVGSHSAVFGLYYDNIVIENNEFKDIKSQAVHCENYRNCSISDNTIKNCNGGIDFNAICYAPDGNFYAPHGSLPKYESIKSYNAKTVISGNNISVKKGSSLTNASGIYVHGGKASSERTKSVASAYYKKAFRITGVDVEYNVITSARSSGVYLSYVDNYNVEGNQIKGIVSGSAARGMGVYLDNCSGGTVQSNHIYKTKSHGIYLTSCTSSVATPTSLYDNRVNVTQNTGCIGIYLKKSRYVDVTKNIVKAKSYAVYLNGSATVTVGAPNAGNTLTSGAKYGVYATGKSKQGIFVQHNLITCKQEATHAASGSKINASNNAVKVKK